MPVTVTVDDGKGGTASDTVNIQVTRPPVRNYTFEDVHFDFDRYTLRPEATRVLDEAVAALQEDDACASRSKATPATSARPNTTWRSATGARTRCATTSSAAASRPTGCASVSYGEERPKYDNAREETRRLNRRAALVVNLS